MASPALHGCVAHLLAALRCSLQGVAACFRQEVAFRQECAVAIPHFLLLILIPMELWLRFYLGGLWFLVVSAELMNTAIEAAADLASPEWHELAKKAKDCGSAAVLSVLVVYMGSWFFVIGRFIMGLFSK